MDKCIITVLKAVATRDLISAENAEDYCLFCGADEIRRDIAELKEVTCKPDCPVVLARRALQDMDAPVSIYRLDYECCTSTDRNGAHWAEQTYHVIACSESDAISSMWQNTRNERVTFVRAFPLDEVKNDER